ncbi:hypothetical protein GCM10012275_32160 [Longimycelium tulufanense]|uniref:Tachylectin 2 domain-containing protein n=1 Tax=Longimycelium tulufanense TaxID=907463 RepID=A0A8J3CF88_9PSEU|nr:hypothetical protein GCM10012275_32160 [Longimycelium tulufanense]
MLYARDTEGKLFRYHYDHTNKRWLQKEKLVGFGGWEVYYQLFSPGGDVLYAVTNDGLLRWYRYLPEREIDWAGPNTIGLGGWRMYRDVMTNTDACKLKKSS